ncbi:hypothetical protein NE235_07410 [Actinoallomurus spadix]|uniref:Uncharacterized protein n=1 Tax=Actinoallomurus spadix TaxID=79912 RepID=A0ABP3FM09_9ACTN|nr:hypothetical protein [Actinoallomurus spadix]MCO5985930.1 hypothetical protein [Actinoallomurus spadix]
MVWIMVALAGAAAGFSIGRTYAGARDAHHHFSDHRARTNTDLRDWITGSVRTGSLLVGLLIALYLLYRVTGG